MSEVTLEEFKKLELKVAKIKEAADIPGADKLYLIKVDMAGEEKQIVAGIKAHYSKEELAGKLIVVVNNLKPATIRGVESQAMLLAAHDEAGLSIITLDKVAASGSLVK